ncbi:MAG: hypothetical protein Q8941_12485 [Bacteroidota bacterium]|nr:hypothetical protein [Bacteroidota bacterium]
MQLQQFNIATKAVSKVVLVAILILLNGCHSLQRTETMGKKISLVVNYPVIMINDGVHSDVHFFNLRDTVFIFYYGRYILYRLPGTRKFETDEKIAGSEPWFIYRKQSAQGYLFTSISDSTRGMKLPADSFLHNRAFAGASFDISTSDSLVERSGNKNTLVEKYFCNKSNNENYPDSFYFYFSDNFKNIDYTFSRKLDSLRKMKLYKVRILYNEKTSSAYQKVLPKREFLFEIRNEGKNISKELIDFISRVSKSYVF